MLTSDSIPGMSEDVVQLTASHRPRSTSVKPYKPCCQCAAPHLNVEMSSIPDDILAVVS